METQFLQVQVEAEQGNGKCYMVDMGLYELERRWYLRECELTRWQGED